MTEDGIKVVNLTGPKPAAAVELPLFAVDQISPWTLSVDRGVVPVPDGQPMPKALRIAGRPAVFHLWGQDAETTVYASENHMLRLHVIDGSAVV